MATEQARAQLLLEYVSSGATQAAAGMETVAKKSAEAGAGWAKLAASWKSIRSGEYAARASEVAMLTREQQKLAEAQRRLDVVAREGKFLGTLTLMQERLQGVGRAGAWGFGLLSVGLGGWIRSGMAGTAEAQRLSHSIQVLSRSIAGVFAPWIQKAVEWVSQLAARFNSLTGAQQESIRRWVALAAGITGTMMLLPRLVGALALVTKAFQAVGLAKIAALAGPIGIAVAAGVGALASTQGGREALGRFLKAMEPLLEALGNLASTILEAAGPALTALADWLAKGVNALAWFVEALVEGGRKLLMGLGMTLEATTTELTAWVAHLQKAQRENMAELNKIAREKTGGRLGGEEYLAEQQKRLADRIAGPAKTGLTAAGSGFERPEDLWRRLQTAVARSGAGGSPEERTAKASEASLEELRKIAAREGRTEASGALESGRQTPLAGS